MRIISSDEIDSALAYPELIETLLRAYRSRIVVPQPAHFPIERPDETAGILRAIPAWSNFVAQGHTDRGYIGCGITLELPQSDDTPDIGSSQSGSALYLLLSGTTGHPVALLDGVRLAVWRRCALHALATRYLAREDTSRLLVLGSDPMLPSLLAAYTAVRDIRSVLLMGGAEAFLDRLRLHPKLKGVTFGATDDLAGAVAGADMICCASGCPLDLPGAALSPGVHIDVFDPGTRLEEDMLSQVRIFVGDRNEAGMLTGEEIAADLRELAKGEKAGRRFYGQMTHFHPGGSSGLADLAVAGHIYLRS
ncbi:ornithine cyclodeaminase [Roseibium aggregatum]|uniref:Ornithine cyclodeaminase n=1 Tax=Roseibium aggregatum TaxID=187304 RepID=A0A926P1J0_9HYPH|nr:ornithine cyclodeaminase [Roseibium aggregatum]MBD1547743.1 ornithine cyclodeaminase [Roseibium aggregatum]